MQGPPEPREEHGIIPNAFYHIFETVNTTPNKEFLVRASYLEIYNEEIRDLLFARHILHFFRIFTFCLLALRSPPDVSHGFSFEFSH